MLSCSQSRMKRRKNKRWFWKGARLWIRFQTIQSDRRGRYPWPQIWSGRLSWPWPLGADTGNGTKTDQWEMERTGERLSDSDGSGSFCCLHVDRITVKGVVRMFIMELFTLCQPLIIFLGTICLMALIAAGTLCAIVWLMKLLWRIFMAAGAIAVVGGALWLILGALWKSKSLLT